VNLREGYALIRVMKVKSKNNFKYCKKIFEIDEVYKAYISKSGIIVINEGQRVYFEDRIPGHFIWDTSIESFKNNFEVIQEDLVHSKAELNKFIG